MSPPCHEKTTHLLNFAKHQSIQRYGQKQFGALDSVLEPSAQLYIFNKPPVSFTLNKLFFYKNLYFFNLLKSLLAFYEAAP